MTDVFATATGLLGDLAAGRTTSTELLDAFLEQIERRPWVNAVVTLDAENAGEQAAAADRARAAGESLGPLHGLPITIKHEFEVAGIESTFGSETNRGHVPKVDAEAVRRLRAAGAIVFGRTNLPEFAADGQSYNPLHGTTSNPWDPTRTPGGSSGGSAAAVAAGMTGLDLGSDMGGSIRLPASWCGVHGLKPTWGVVPTTGSAPVPGAATGSENHAYDIAVVGPLTRGAADLELALSVLVAGDRGPGHRLPEPRFRTHRDLRAFAWLDDEPATEAATLAVLEEACTALQQDGVELTYGTPPRLVRQHLADLFELLFMADLSIGLGDDAFTEAVDGLRALSGEAPLAEMHLRALQLSHREWLALQRDRLQVQRCWSELFEGVDVVLTPSVITTAIHHDHSEPVQLRTFDVDGATRWHRPDLTSWCAPVSVSLLPAVSAPAGTTEDGLPVGMQIIADSYRDRSAIAAAALLERTRGGFQVPPLAGSHD